MSELTFVQFVKNKPIKHGIKVFAYCCAYSGVILSFFVYCGKENTSEEDTSTIAICDKLVRKAGLTGRWGRVLVMDNYYTTINLARHMFER